MADENLKDFTINWILVGVLSFSLISFAIAFMYNNNPSGLEEGVTDKLNQSSSGMNSKLLEIESGGNQVLNITSNTNPEASQLGSRDSVSAAFQTQGKALGFWESFKILVAWIVGGDIGKMLVSVFGGIFAFTAAYWITKWIRNGL